MRNKITKKAAADFRYVKAEFKYLKECLDHFTNKYRQSFTASERLRPTKHDFNIANKFCERYESILQEVKIKLKSAINNFTKSVERNHREELIQQIGEDYEELLYQAASNPEDAYDKTKGIFTKYKLIMQLFVNQDKDLIDRVMKYIKYEISIYETKIGNARSELNKIQAELSGDPESYNWLNKYHHLFSFAQEMDDEEELEELEVIELKLKESEIRNLKGITELWKSYKQELDSDTFTKYMHKIRAMSSPVGGIEKERNEMLNFLFNRINVLKKYIDSLVETSSENEFFEGTGLSFENAAAKIDLLVYTLATMFPTYSGASKLLRKMPRKFDALLENKFFDRGKQYERGEISGTPEDGDEIFSRKTQYGTTRYPRSLIPLVRSYYIDAFKIIRKAYKNI